MKKKFTKSLVAMLALIAMLTQNAYGVYAAATAPEPIQVENEFVEEVSDPVVEVVEEPASAEDNGEEGTPVEYVDGEVQETDEQPTDDVNYDDQIMLLEEDSAEESIDDAEEVEEADEQVPEELEILETQISGAGLEELEVYINTDDLNEGDSFRIIFTGPDSARYDTRLNDNLDTTSNGTYRFLDLKKEGFNIRATSDDDVSFVFTSEGSTPVIKAISNVEEVEKKFTTKSITLGDGSPVTAIDGVGFEKIKINLDTKELSKKAEYTLYIDTEATVTVNGKSFDGMVSGLKADEEEFVVEGLDKKDFVAYVSGDNEIYVTSEITIDDEENGLATLILKGEEPRVKADYEYEDSKVRVTATLTDPKAVPDDAIFKVTEIVSENAVDAYIGALNNASNEEEEKYTNENTLLYDIAFLVEKTDEDGNVIEGEYEEYEPEVGSVKIEITFKGSQISDDLGATESEEVEINHLPLSDAVKDSVDTTVDANGAIDAKDVIVEPVKADVDVNEGAADTVTLSLSDLSVVALTVLNSNVSVAKVTDFSLESSLGDANDYGVIANYYSQTGDTETNCYAAKYKGSAQDLGASSNYSNAGGDNYIGDFEDGCSLPIRFHQEPRYVYLGDAAWEKAYKGTNKNTKKAVASEMSTAYFDLSKCAATEFYHEQKNVTSTLSSIGTYYNKYVSVKDENNNAPVFKTVTKDNGAKLGATAVDLTNKGSGLFVTNYVGGSLKTDGDGWMDLKLDASSQKLLINVTPNSDTFDLSYYKLNGKSVNSYVADGGKDADALATSVILNFGDYSGTIKIKEIAAVIIAPEATIYTESTCAGIVACDKLYSHGGEWHYHNHNLPGPGSFTFKATKFFENDIWPETGEIKLKLEALDVDDPIVKDGNWVSAKAPLPGGATEPIIITVTKDNPVAEFGSVEYPYNAPTGHRQDPVNKNNTINCRCYMYKITEVNTGIRNVTYDDHYQVIKVWVNQKTTGTGSNRVAIEVNGSTKMGECQGTLGPVEFHNKYNPARGKIVIKKEIEGKGLSVGPYFFEVQQKNDPYKRLTQSEGIDENWNKIHTFALNAGETFELTNVPAGEYTVVEYKSIDGWKDPKTNNGDNNEVPVDDTVLGYKVVYEGGQNVTITGNEQITKVVKNVSTYGEDKLVISGKKTVTPASYGIAANDYSFTIKRATASDNTGVEIPNYNGSAPLPGDTTVKNDANGNFSFGEIKYDADHLNKTYYYVVYEESGEAFGMTYDGKKFLVKVEVKADENGKVKAAKTVSQIGGALTDIQFTNTVTAKGEETFSAHKTLTGKTLEAKQFTFKLEKGTKADGSDKTELKTVMNGEKGAVGSVDFDITESFTEGHIGNTYYYFVTEEGPAAKTNGITYSKAEYRYTVTINGIKKNERVEKGQPAKLDITKTVDVKNADGTWSAYTANNEVPEFENTYDAEGGAVITVHKNTGDTASSAKLASTVFTFKVSETDAAGNVLMSGGEPKYQKTKDVTGAGTAVFNDLKYTSAGTYYYTVEEVYPDDLDENNTKDGITYDVTKHKVVIVTEDKGAGNIEVVSQTNDNNSVEINTAIEIKNTYSVIGTETYLEGIKTLSGKELREKAFQFKISAVNGAPLPEKTEVTNGADNQAKKIKFGPIAYGAEGTYEYVIEETSVNGAGITVDTRKYTAKVVVEDVKGQLVVKSKDYYLDNVKVQSGEFQFDNTYTASGKAKIVATKVLDANNIKTLKDKEFEFELCKLNGSTYERIGETVRNNGSGKVEFPELSYKLADADKEFTYYIHEVIAERDKKTGYEYDETYHPVYVTVTDNGNGTISTDVTYGASRDKSLTITNKYRATGTATVSGSKRMVGRKIADGEVINFKLIPLTSGDKNKEMPASITGNGTSNTGEFSFDLSYDTVGTFEYNVVEVAGDDKQVTYDTTVYKAIVTVSDASAASTTGFGKLNADVKVEGDKDILFTNTSEQTGSFTPYAKKTLSGGTLQARDFEFTLTDQDGKVQTVKNGQKSGDAVSAVTFDTINYSGDFSTPKTYTYIIAEKPGSQSYITTYDKTQYKIVVTVSESATSKLDVSAKYYKKLEGDTDFSEIQNGSCADFEFVNTYKAEGEKAFGAKKELEGGVTLLAKEFEFELVDLATGEVVQTKPNDAKGVVSFDALKYTQEDLKGDSDGKGTYYRYYKIREKQVSNTGYTYDDTNYIVRMSIKDKYDGTLDVNYKIVKADAKEKEQTKLGEWITNIFNRNGVEAKFINSYEANGKATITAHKVLNGKPLNSGDFEFTIKEGNEVIDTKSNDGNSVTFDDIFYTLEDIGTHTYTVTEKYKGQTEKGIKYSDAEYTVTVAVAEKTNSEGAIIRDGKLSVNTTVSVANASDEEKKIAYSIVPADSTFTVKDANNVDVTKPIGTVTVGPLAFVNDYNTTPADVVIAGKKTISGLGATEKIADYAGKFTFTIEDTEVTDEEGNAVSYTKDYADSQTNGNDGTYSFNKITFTRADLANGDGTYAASRKFVYTVTESATPNADVKGIEFDGTNPKTVTVLVTDNGSGVLSANVVDKDENGYAVRFTNVKVAEGELPISVTKEVTGTESTDKEFTFTLTGTGITAKEIKLKKGDTKSFEPAIKYTLEQVKAAGGTYTADYTVTESASNYDGYTDDAVRTHTIHAEVTLVDGKLVVKRRVDNETELTTGAVAFTYTNTYAAKGSLKVEGDKILTGRDMDKDEFTFKITGPKLPEEGVTVNNEAAQKGVKSHFSFNFEDLYNQSDAGKTYTYTVTEVVPDEKLPNVTYDETVYTAVAVVTDNGNGTLNVDVKTKKGTTTAPILFENDYKSSSDVIKFSAEKSLSGRELKDGMFTFKLEDVSGKKLKNAEEVTNTSTAVNFTAELKYDQDDVNKDFRYKISEINKTNKKLYTYDDNVYYAKVDVSIVDGKVVAERNYYSDEACTKKLTVSKPKFENEYHSSAKINLSGTKKLEGFDKINDKGSYTFELLENKVVIDTFTVSGAGAFKFPSAEGKKYKDTTKNLLEYTQDDLIGEGGVFLTDKEFIYTVKEVNDNKAGVTYDDTEYTVTVNVSIDNTTGELTATPHFSPDVDAEGLVFTNRYNAKGELDLVGKKSITGKKIANRAYTFALAKKIDGKFEEIATTVNDGHKFGFKADSVTKNNKKINYFKYTQGDIGETFEYQVTEKSATDGSEIDTTVYTITDVITEAESADEELHIARTITKPGKDEDGKDIVIEVNSTDFEFKNVYEAEGEIVIDGTKTLKNSALLGDDFTFVLRDSSGKIVEDKDGNKFIVTNEVASLDKDGKAVGKFEFPALKYTQDALKYTNSNGDDSYSDSVVLYYTVEEQVQNPKDCITYSNVIYNVAVTVADSKKGDGKLVVTKVVTSNQYSGEGATSLKDRLAAIFGALSKDAKSEDINFVNEYTAEGYWDPAGNKTLTGRKLEDNAFQFKISEIGKLGGKVLKDEDGNEKEAFVKNIGTTVVFNHENVDWLKYGIEDVGMHYYRVEEVVPSQVREGDTYDSTVFEYAVNVTDAGDGKLSADTVKMDTIKDGKTTSVTAGNFEFSFDNKFKAEGKISFAGKKTMKGRLLGDDKYSFSLYESEKPLANPTNVVKATNDAEGNIIFPDTTAMLNYRIDADHDADEVLGKHYYIISEDDTSIPGVIKSETLYRITVNVTDPQNLVEKQVGTGNLSAEVIKVEVASKSASGYTFSEKELNKANLFSFENTYEAKADIAFLGIKHLKNLKGGKDVTSMTELDGKFEFRLLKFEDDARTGTGTLVKSTRCDGDGNYKIAGISYSQDDLESAGATYADHKDYFYRIEEVIPAGAEKKDFNGKEYWFYNGVYYNTDDIVSYDVNVRISPTTPASNKLDVVVTDAKTGAVIQSSLSGNTYMVGGNGYFDFENIKPLYKEIRGKKTWVDSVTDPATRPTVTVRLYSSEDNFTKVIDTKSIVAPAYEYEFTELPAVDASGKEITYKVDEADIPGYTSEQIGYDFINTSGELLIRKVSEETGLPLEGAVLTIIDSAGKEVDRWTSGTSAHVVDLTKVTIGAEYTLHEESAPTGYMVAADKKFTVSAGSTTVVTMEDPRIIGSVRLRKLDAETRAALSGAEFALYREDGERIYASGSAGSYRYSSSSSNGRFAVDGSGELEITGLPYGSYYFTEIAAPTGYALSSERVTFSVLTDGSVAEVTFLNTKERGSVRLRKTNSDGSVSLAGAVFELYAKTPSSITAAIASTIYSGAYYRVGTYITDASGMIYVDDLPWDDYYFVEVEAPTGYEVNTDTNGELLVYAFTLGSSDTAEVSYDLGRITNGTTSITLPTPPITPPRGGEVRGARKPTDSGRRAGGVLSGVLGVRAAPKAGVLGERLGPVTGDAFNIFLWMLLLLASVGAIVAVAITNAKRKKQAK